MSPRRRVFFVSDRTGITVEALGSSLLTQFADVDFLRVTLPFIDSIPKAIQVVAQVNEARRDSGQRPLVFSSIVDDEVRAEIRKCDALVLDVFERFIVPLEGELDMKSLHAVGRSHSAIRAYSEMFRAPSASERRRRISNSSCDTRKLIIFVRLRSRLVLRRVSSLEG